MLVDFYADWCGPCKLLDPTVEQRPPETDVTVATVDVEESPSIASRYDVQSTSAFVVFEDGRPADRGVGMRALSDRRAAFEGKGTFARAPSGLKRDGAIDEAARAPDW